jgi:hypothetical protein
MQNVYILLNLAAFIAVLIWLIIRPDWEPLAATLGTLATLIALLLKQRKTTKNIMKQTGGKNSKNIQAGGDITITK